MDKQPMVQIIIGQMVYVVPVTISHSDSCDFYEFTYIYNQVNNTIRVSTISSISMDTSQCMVQILIDQNKQILPVNMQYVLNGYIYEFELLHNKIKQIMSIYVPHQPITAFKPVTTLKPFIPVCQTGYYQKLSNSVQEVTDRSALIQKELEKFVSLLQNITNEQQNIIYQQMKNIFGSRNTEDYTNIEITPIQNIYQMINNNQNKKGFLEYIQNTNNSLKLLECLQQEAVQQKVEKQNNIADGQVEKQMINHQQLSTPKKEQKILNDNVRACVVKNQVQNIVINNYSQEKKPGDTIIDVK
ncbi:Hypothetical_protein [Hexamita inflata]|uniref:Hypothetical_protein n=1 Tax=Hexamita inflata TaxID=28002 RepID=A0AA86USV0_9EUKA|nr:Hypothetical protein HINF_LOCUS54284 [Hexamita inflata]